MFQFQKHEKEEVHEEEVEEPEGREGVDDVGTGVVLLCLPEPCPAA